jgi:YD repeat-containing protein
MKSIKKQSLFALQLILISALFSMIAGCGGGYEYLNKAENPFNYPQLDHFVAKGLNRISDFDLRGNVKNVVQYKATKDPLATKKSLDFDISFTPEGYLLTNSNYHTRAFFFHGKKDLERTVIYKKREKRLLENHVLADSVTVKIINTYDKLGNLITTEDELSLRRYYYDSNERLIKEEQYQKTHLGGVLDTPSLTHTYEIKNDNYKIKTRLREEIPQENLLFYNTFHEFFYYDDAGYLEKRQTATSNDTITHIYNKNRQITSETHTRGGRPFRASTYQYNEKNLLIEERNYRQGTLFQNHTYVYDDRDNLINKTSYLNSRKLSVTTYEYTYDSNNNWITKTTVVKDKFDGGVFELGTISRDIEYY